MSCWPTTQSIQQPTWMTWSFSLSHGKTTSSIWKKFSTASRRPDSLIEAVEQFARPRSKKDVRSFLGLAGYNRQFIQDFAELALPLTKTTTKEQPEKVVWTKELQTSFHRSCRPPSTGDADLLPQKLQTSFHRSCRPPSTGDADLLPQEMQTSFHMSCRPPST